MKINEKEAGVGSFFKKKLSLWKMAKVELVNLLTVAEDELLQDSSSNLGPIL